MVAELCCSCGNPVGLRKCCAKTLNSKPWTGTAVKKPVSEAIKALRQAITDRQFTIAGTIAQRILLKVPNHPMAHYLLGVCCLMQGNSAEAASRFQVAFVNGLKDPEAHVNFAGILGEQSRHDLAFQHFKQALALQARYQPAWRLGYQMASGVGAQDMALFFSQGLLDNFSDEPESWHTHGNALHATTRDDEATAILTQGLERFPDNTDLKLSLAGICELRHDIEQAKKLVQEVLWESPKNLAAKILLARLLRRTGDAPAALAMLEELQRQNAINDEHRSLLHAEYLTIYRQRDDFDKAWQHAQAMNVAVKNHRPMQGQWHQIESQLTQIEQLTTPSLRLAENSHEGRAKPLFVVGFPRTGSTLLEKALVETFDCVSQSESNAIPEVEKSIFQHCGAPWWELESSQIDKLDRARLLQRADGSYHLPESGAQVAVVDKNLFNLSRLKLISMVFQGAPVIRLVRHPLDTIISCYFANFSSSDGWHVDLVQTARYLARLDAHWHREHGELDLNVSTLKYEDFVRAGTLPDALVDTLAGHWASRRPLTSGETATAGKYITRTASYEQVTRPINTSSIDSYKNYLDHIDHEAVDLLGDMMDRWGYRR